MIPVRIGIIEKHPHSKPAPANSSAVRPADGGLNAGAQVHRSIARRGAACMLGRIG
jgi:hypothetical protein